MIVSRTIHLNPIEPAVLSFRAPMGMETKLDVNFLDAIGGIVTEDLAAQLQLSGRSNTIVSFFSMAVTDLVNGKARAVIPADFLVDPNGYALRLTGTLDGEPALLAIGLVKPVASAGPEAVPSDIIDNVPLTFQRDEQALVGIKVWADDAGGVPYDLTEQGTQVAATIYASKGGPVLVPFSVTVTASNAVTLSLTAMQVNALPDSCWWTLTASSGAGLTTLAEGQVSVSGEIQPPFTPVVLSYDYEKPAALTAPAAGQILHATGALDLLRIDEAGNGDTLDQLLIGDTIQVGVTVWSIGAIHKVATYYEVTIAPATQAGVVGTQDVTFARP